jgi:hypothetical protein
MPTVPYGSYEGAEAYRVSVSREDDDTVNVPGKGEMEALRASIGGNDEIGFYLVFRGEPKKVVKMLEMMTAAAKDMLPRGNYKDERRR